MESQLKLPERHIANFIGPNTDIINYNGVNK